MTKFISLLLAFIIQASGLTSLPVCGTQAEVPVDTKNGGDPFMVEAEGHTYYTYTTGSGIDIIEISSCYDTSEIRRKTVYRMGSDGVEGDIWAPEIHKIGDRWYIVASGLFNSDEVPEGTMPSAKEKTDSSDYYRYGFVLESVSEDIFGEYSFKARIAPDGLNNIDGSYLQKDGRLYYVCSAYIDVAHQAIAVAEMENPYTLASGKAAEIISKPVYPFETKGWKVNEGPAVLYKGDAVYIVYSASGYYSGGYCMGMLTLVGDDPMEKTSWLKSPVKVFGKNTEKKLYHPGHCSFVYRESSEILMVYHATDNEDFFASPRCTYVKSLDFIGDYPLFNL